MTSRRHMAHRPDYDTSCVLEKKESEGLDDNFGGRIVIT